MSAAGDRRWRDLVELPFECGLIHHKGSLCSLDFCRRSREKKRGTRVWRVISRCIV